MFKHYSIKCLFITVTVLSVFAFNIGFAQERVFQYVDPPTSETINDPKTGNWFLKAQLEEGLCGEQGTTQTDPPTTGCYTLEISQSETGCVKDGLNAIEILSDKPDNCTTPLGYTYNSPEFKDGAYIRGVSHMLVKEWDASDCKFEIGMSGSQSLVHGTACVKLGRNWFCKELAVPGCFDPECYSLPTGVQTPTSEVECWDLSNRNVTPAEIISVSIPRIAATTYADWFPKDPDPDDPQVEGRPVIWHPGSPDCAESNDPLKMVEAVPIPNETDEGCWQGANQKKECVRKEHESPGCFWFYSGGYYAQYCCTAAGYCYVQ